MIVRAAFRNRRYYLLARLTERWARPLRAYARLKCAQPPSAPGAWRRALILGDVHVGDLLYRTGSLEALQRGLPNCAFYYLAAPGSAEVLRHCPWVQGVLPLCRSDWRSALDAAARAQLKALAFDAALCSNPLHYVQDLKLALDLGIASRAGYTFKGCSAWVTHPITVRVPQPFPAYFREMVAQLTGQAPSWSLRPRVYPAAEDDQAAAALWGELGVAPGRPVVACFLTSRQSRGVWPPDCFGRTLQQVAQRSGAALLLCGAAGDRPVLEAVDRRYGLQAFINAGRVNLLALVCLLRRCALVLSTDSGPRHLANAAGVPVVFVRNLAVDKVETGVYCETEHDLAPAEVERVTPARQAYYLNQTRPEAVAQHIVGLLQQSGPTDSRSASQ